jgi:predicted neutral ceramidase superfamily lipid hydrolase
MTYVAAFVKSAVYVEIVLGEPVYVPVKIVVSIVVPSVYVTVHV